MSNENFKRTTGTLNNGLVVLGVEATVGETRVVLKPGEYDMPLPPIEVSSQDEAREYLRMAKAIEVAHWYNLGVSTDTPSSEEDAFASIARILEWCEAPTKLRGLSHHGVRARVSVNEHGVNRPIKATAREDGVLLQAYSGRVCPVEWPFRMCEEVRILEKAAAALNRDVVKQWNGGKSTVISCQSHKTVLEAFDKLLAEKSARSEVGSDKLPEGWEK